MTLEVSRDELRRKIELILSQVGPGERIYRFTDRELMAKLLERHASAGVAATQDLDVVIEGAGDVVSEKVLLLKTLYSQCGSELRVEFLGILVHEITAANASVVVHSILELGEVEGLREMLKERDVRIRHAIWSAVREKLHREPNRFADADLDAIETLRAHEAARTRKPRRASEDRFIH